MNTQSNAVPQAAADTRASAKTTSSLAQPFYWSVRRELWENRSLYIAPLAVTAVYLFGFLLYSPKLASNMRAALDMDPMHQRHMLEQPYNFVAVAIMGIAFLIGLLYCVEALYSERRDRSILFWKSMPVSDLTTVLSKAFVPIVFVPLFCFALTVTAQYIMLFLNSAVLAASGLPVAILWSRLALFRTSLMLLYHLVAVHMLWYAPIYAWLLLVSAWARRVPILWAVLPPVAIAMFERVVFHTSYFVSFIGSRFGGDTSAESAAMEQSFPIHPAMHPTPVHFLATPGLWLGLIFAAICLAAAVRLRRYREPI